MRMNDIIIKKRDGYELSIDELKYVVNGYVNGEIPDYQVSAWLMSVYFRGMTDNETFNLTNIMKDTGYCVDFNNKKDIFVDKHSTGGIGDKTTMIVAPIVAACGLKIGKMSGKSLGYAGGTIDKLQSIKGYKTDLGIEDFVNIVNSIGLSLIGQSKELVPGDKCLYALRDCTGTVESIPLIAASIMSKKLAVNSSCIVLDVKYGDGAFMRSEEDAEKLARQMIMIGTRAGRKVAALLSENKEPLGYCIGNAIEVQEAIEVLKGKKVNDLYEICEKLVTILLSLANSVSYEENRKLVGEVIANGEALKKFYELLVYHGVDQHNIDNFLFDKPTYSLSMKSPRAGYINKIGAEMCGRVSMALGAGRNTIYEQIDYAAGIKLLKKTGDWVEQGEPIAILFSSDKSRLDVESIHFLDAFEIGETNLYRKPNTKIIW